MPAVIHSQVARIKCIFLVIDISYNIKPKLFCVSFAGLMRRLTFSTTLIQCLKRINVKNVIVFCGDTCNLTSEI